MQIHIDIERNFMLDKKNSKKDDELVKYRKIHPKSIEIKITN
jgi:hypothetical protein